MTMLDLRKLRQTRLLTKLASLAQTIIGLRGLLDLCGLRSTR